MFWLISHAFAGVPLLESDLQEMCVSNGTCPQILGTVIDAECYGVQEDQMGAIVTRYRATISVIENMDEFDISETFILQTTNYDYSQAEAQPNCYENDPGHPVGEIARYYLDPVPEDGIYFLYQGGTAYPTEDSMPSELPECPSLEEDTESTGEEEVDTKTGCTSVASPIHTLYALFPLLWLYRRRR